MSHNISSLTFRYYITITIIAENRQRATIFSKLLWFVEWTIQRTLFLIVVLIFTVGVEVRL